MMSRLGRIAGPCSGMRSLASCIPLVGRDLRAVQRAKPVHPPSRGAAQSGYSPVDSDSRLVGRSPRLRMVSHSLSAHAFVIFEYATRVGE